jgi:hypothetical protein
LALATNILQDCQAADATRQSIRDSAIQKKYIDNFFPASKLLVEISPEFPTSTPIIENVKVASSYIMNSVLDELVNIQVFTSEVEKRKPILEQNIQYASSARDLILNFQPLVFDQPNYRVICSLIADQNKLWSTNFKFISLTLSSKGDGGFKKTFTLGDFSETSSYSNFCQTAGLSMDDIANLPVISAVEFHSHCIFSRGTDIVVSLLIKDGKCNIVCYHPSCKANRRYEEMANSFRATLMPLILLNKSYPFNPISGPVTSYISSYLKMEEVYNILKADMFS